MTITYHTNFDQRSGAWEKIRCGKLTCSNLDKILTPKTFQPSKQMKGHALKLAAERIKGKAEDSPTSFDMERGIELEPEARYQYEQQWGKVEVVAFVENSVVPFPFGGSPDGLIDNRKGGIEIKCPRATSHLDTLLHDEIDGGYVLQMQGVMLAAGLDYIDFVSFHEGLKLKPIRVYRDEKTINAILEAGKQLEENIQNILSQYNKLPAYNTALPEEIAL